MRRRWRRRREGKEGGGSGKREEGGQGRGEEMGADRCRAGICSICSSDSFLQRPCSFHPGILLCIHSRSVYRTFCAERSWFYAAFMSLRCKRSPRWMGGYMFVNKSAHRSECKPRRVLPEQNCLCLPFPLPFPGKAPICLFVWSVCWSGMKEIERM